MSTIPTYRLYGEQPADPREFWVHCETIVSRSSGYRFEIGLHRHESFLQFLYIRNGSGDALLPSGTVVLKPPCVIAVPPGPVHGFRFSQDIDGLVLTLVPERMGADLAGPQNPLSDAMVIALSPESADTAYLEATFFRIAAEYEAQRPARDELLEAHVATVILMLGRLLAPSPRDSVPDLALRRVRALKELILSHHREQLTVETYARMLGITSTHLNRVVKEVTGKTAHDLIMDRSIEEARRALVFTGHSIQHIAESLGYSDPAYFSRCFRRCTGQTPRGFRDEERQRLRNKDEHASV
ncbi:helix-turn-helix domain-containing protein [Rhizobium sp. SGZ-381]|uniref:helix-turn-helix domain-containing protein n=1 Tax=Rhizobium sp. SGZ-381 TaxID=3342800 RepID=UPI00366E922E